MSLFSACQKDQDIEVDTETGETEFVDVENLTDHDDPDDYIWDESNVVPIVLNGSSTGTVSDGLYTSGSYMPGILYKKFNIFAKIIYVN